MGLNPAPGASSMSGLLPRTALRPDRPTLICLLACSAGLAWWTVSLTGGLTAAEAVFFLLLPWCAWSLGRAVMALAGVDAGAAHPAPLELLVGLLAGAILLFVLSCTSPLALRGNCLVAVAVCLAAPLLLRPAVRPSGTGAGLLAVVAVVVALVAATLWTGVLRPYAVADGDRVVFKPWWDYFYHASLAARVGGSGGVFRQGNWDTFGAPVTFYHYAGYIYPAALRAWGPQTGYDTLGSLWAPLGYLLCGLAAFALAGAWWGDRAGLAAVAAALLLPDTSTYGLKSPWCAFNWNVQTSPSMVYGVAISAVGLLFVTQGVARGRWRPVVAGFLAGGCCLLFKAQFLFAAPPLYGLWVVAFFPGLGRARRAVLLAAGLAAGGAFVFLSERFSAGPTLIPRAYPYGVSPYLSLIVSLLPESQFRSFFQVFADGGLVVQHPARAILFVLAATAGALLLVYPVLVLWGRRLR
ncbi:MAG TPA: hypothetical protein VFW33_12425, partial [Gemmataceae bacterium]|nr:hypothetical protein [Gemmataceae bacterium]